MPFLEMSQTTSAVVTLCVVAAMFVMFLRETFPTEVVAIAGAALMLALGVLPYDAALTVLSNPAPWTIAAMFIIMGALVRTGALDAFTSVADRKAKSNPSMANVIQMGFVVLS
jgi:Na+/H+ antiporter NhaD/arsenite permease-like protein